MAQLESVINQLFRYALRNYRCTVRAPTKAEIALLRTVNSMKPNKKQVLIMHWPWVVYTSIYPAFIKIYRLRLEIWLNVYVLKRT